MITIDVHTHILPGIDDGANHMEDALALLRMEAQQGVKTVVLTPHFDLQNTKLQAFVEKRAYIVERLRREAAELPIQLLVGAEVMYSPRILECADALCIEGTSYLLVEFPMYAYPQIAIEVFRELCQRGITPIIAHGERYLFSGAVALLEKLTNNGALLQVNVDGILDRKLKKRIYELADRDLISLLASDTHSPITRRPAWEKALPKWKKKVPGLVSYCEENALEILKKEVLK